MTKSSIETVCRPSPSECPNPVLTCPLSPIDEPALGLPEHTD